MIDLEQISRIIQLSPARQNQVCYRARITSHAQGADIVFYPTLDFFDQGRTVAQANQAIYRSMLFHVGMTVASLETWAQQQGYSVTVKDSINETPRSYDNLAGWMHSNRERMLGYMATWIQQQKTQEHVLFAGYEYDMGKCVRDFGFLVDAICEDLAWSTHNNTAGLAGFYWGVDGPVSRRPQELAIHQELRRWIDQETQANPIQWRNQLLSLYDLFIDLIDQGPRPDLADDRGSANTDYVRVTINE